MLKSFILYNSPLYNQRAIYYITIVKIVTSCIQIILRKKVENFDLIIKLKPVLFHNWFWKSKPSR